MKARVDTVTSTHTTQKKTLRLTKEEYEVLKGLCPGGGTLDQPYAIKILEGNGLVEVVVYLEVEP